MARPTNKDKAGEEQVFLLDNIINTLQSEMEVDGNCDIIDFIYNILGFDSTLFIGQSVLLKCIYNLELNEEEEALLDVWQREGKTNYKNFGKDHNWMEVVVAAGMRAGKSMCAAFIVAYEFYKMHVHPNPQKLYGLHSSALIRITAVATSESQTLQTIFGQAKAAVQGSPYFKAEIAKNNISVLETKIISNTKNITVLGGHSRSASLVGSTGKLVVYDEIARMAEVLGDLDKVNNLYTTVGRSTANFGVDGKKISISSVWKEGDYLQLLEDQGWDRAKDNVLVFHLMTKDLNSRFDYKINPYIPNEIAKDPIGGRRDYESIRPKTVDGFLDPLEIEKARSGNPILSQVPTVVTLGKESFVGLDISIPATLKYPYQSWIHLDPGKSEDSYALVIGHAEQTESNGIAAVIDACLVWKPEVLPDGSSRKVSFTDVERVVRILVKSRNVIEVTSDHWQNEHTLQRLQSDGIVCREINFKGTTQFHIYSKLRTWLNTGKLILPDAPYDPYPMMEQELRELILINGQRVDHPRKFNNGARGSKDIADGIAVICDQVSIYERNNSYGLSDGSEGEYTRQNVRILNKREGSNNLNPAAVFGGLNIRTDRRNIYNL